MKTILFIGSKRKKRLIQNLGHLAAIQNDYIREPDGLNAGKLLVAIARDIGGNKAANQMIDEANHFASLRHNVKDAENSNPRAKEEK